MFRILIACAVAAAAIVVWPIVFEAPETTQVVAIPAAPVTLARR